MSILSFFGLKDSTTINEISNNLMHSLPFTIPLIWLAIYASKRRSENQRLEQEYAHKETLAKSYSGYKQQIEQLSEKDKELLAKLLTAAIDSISYNASNTLDKKHGDGTVFQEILKQIAALKKSDTNT